MAWPAQKAHPSNWRRCGRRDEELLLQGWQLQVALLVLVHSLRHFDVLGEEGLHLGAVEGVVLDEQFGSCKFGGFWEFLRIFKRKELDFLWNILKRKLRPC
jgi:hypothetical protein